MVETLEVGGVTIQVTRKPLKNIHLTVHPPDGQVRVAAPTRTELEAIRLFAISKLPWIRQQQRDLQGQEREPQREFLDRESHLLWGQRYLLRVVERTTAGMVLEDQTLTLFVRPGMTVEQREAVAAKWYRDQVREAVPALLKKWAPVLGVEASKVYVRRMKTKWGSCNPAAGTIRLNTELAKKSPQCLEYVVVHELMHMLEPTHNARFIQLMDQHMPSWRHHRDELNRAPLAHEDWQY